MYSPKITIASSSEHLFLPSSKLKQEPVTSTDLLTQLFLVQGYDAYNIKKTKKKPTMQLDKTNTSNPPPSTVYLTGQTFDQITREGPIISPPPDNASLNRKVLFDD